MNTLNPFEWESLEQRFMALQAADLKLDNVAGWLQEWSELAAQLAEADAQIYREITENTADEEAEKRFLHWIEQIQPQVKVATQHLKEKWLALPGYVPSPDVEQFHKRFRVEATMFREENVPLQTELAKLGNEAEKIVGGMTVNWDGEELTLPQVRQKQESSDRSERERAWRAEMERFAQARQSLNELFLQMRTLRQKMARNAGFPHFRDYQWQVYGRFDYTPADAFTFHDSILYEVVPVAAERYRTLQSKLGVESLRPWDTKADPHGAPLEPFSTADELERGGDRIFRQVDPQLAQHFTAMRDGWLDLASRPNKAPGGYCNAFPASKKPYIFMNAVGTNGDVSTLLHEGGHAFHFVESALAQPLVWNMDGPMEFCEVASMSMELLGAPFLAQSKGGFYSDADARRAYAETLEGSAIYFLPYMAIVDLFQHWLYAEADDDITADDLDAKWGQLWDLFMIGIDTDGLESEKVTGWHRKMHIFTAPFYYIEYGLAQVGALQVWRNSLSDYQGAVANYRNALRLGYTRPLPDLFEAAGAKLSFDRPMLSTLMGAVRTQLNELEQ